MDVRPRLGPFGQVLSVEHRLYIAGPDLSSLCAHRALMAPGHVDDTGWLSSFSEEIPRGPCSSQSRFLKPLFSLHGGAYTVTLGPRLRCSAHNHINVWG